MPENTPGYRQKVYGALKDNLEGFNKTEQEFNAQLDSDPQYATKVFSALKDNLQGFDKTEDQFYSLVGIKKKIPVQTNLPSTSVSSTSALGTGSSGSQNVPNGFLPGDENFTNLRPPTEEEWQQIEKNPKKEDVYINTVTPLGRVEKTKLHNPEFDQEKYQKIQDEAATKKLINTFQNYEQVKPTTLGTVNPMTDAGQFYLQYLKEHNPDQYNYEVEKFGANQNKPLEKEKQMADYIIKGLSLRAQAIDGMHQEVKNERNVIGGDLSQLENTTKQLQDVDKKLSSLKDEINARYTSVFDQNAKFDQNGMVIIPPGYQPDFKNELTQYSDLSNTYNQLAQQQYELANRPDIADLTQKMSKIAKDYQNNYAVAKDFIDGITAKPFTTDSEEKLRKAFPHLIGNKIEDYYNQQVTNEGYENMPYIPQQVKAAYNAIGRSIDNMLVGLTYIPKMIAEKTGDKSSYGWTDKFYDASKNYFDQQDKMTFDLPDKSNLPVYNEKTGDWNLSYLPTKMAGTGATIAMMALGGEFGAGMGELAAAGKVGQYAGSFATGYVMSAENAYKEAIDAGMTEKDANDFAIKTGVEQSMIEMLFPEEKIFTKSIMKSSAKKYAEAISKGVSKNEALAETLKGAFKNAGKEVGEEELQQLVDFANKYYANEKAGVNFDLKDAKNDFIETALVTFASTFPMSLAGAKTNRSTMQKEALYMASQQVDKMSQRIDEMVKEGQMNQETADVTKQKIQLASEELKKMPDNISVEKKINILPSLVEKRLIEEKKKTTDKVFHPEQDAAIKQKEEEIRSQLTPSGQEEVKTENNVPALNTGEQTELDYLNYQQEQGLPLNEEEQNRLTELTNKQQNAVQKQTAGEVGVRNETTVREGMGQENQSEVTSQQGSQNQQNQEEVVSPASQNVTPNTTENGQNKNKGQKGQEGLLNNAETSGGNNVSPDVISEEDINNLSRTAEDRRKAGKYTKDNIEYVRQELVKSPAGKSTTVKFSQSISYPGEYTVIEADQLQPSHLGGSRNPNFFIPEAQPKERTDIASKKASDQIAANPNFQEISEGTTAYIGAPVINQRGEVIQGNNRAEGLKKHYGQNQTSYKEDLIANAKKFGLDEKSIQGMKQPVLVRKINTDDKTAIQLGNYDVKDIESGGKRRLDVQQLAARLPDDAKKSLVSSIENIPEGQTLNKVIRENFDKILRALSPKYINDAQVANMVDKNTGDPKPAGLQDIEGLYKELLFTGGAPGLNETFESFPNNVKEGITKSISNILSVPADKSILEDLQNSMLSMNEFYQSGIESFDDWSTQGDIFADGKTPAEIYTPVEMALAKKIIEAKNQKEVKEIFSKYKQLTEGTEGDMFNQGTEALTKESAIKEEFGVEYKPVKKETNEQPAKAKNETTGKETSAVNTQTGEGVVGKEISGEKSTGQKVNLKDKFDNLIERSVTAGLTADKTMSILKKNPDYQNMIDESGISEDEFKKEVESKFPEENKKETVPPVATEEEGKQKRAHTIRLEDNQKTHSEILKRMTNDEKTYNPVKLNEVATYLEKVLDQYQKEDKLLDLANSIIDNPESSPFNGVEKSIANYMIGERLLDMADKKENEFIRESLLDASTRLHGLSGIEATNAAQLLALRAILATRLPSNTLSLKRRFMAEAYAIQEQNLTAKQKEEIKSGTTSLNEILQSEEVQKEIEKLADKKVQEMAEKRVGKEKVSKIRSIIASAKIDVKEC